MSTRPPSRRELARQRATTDALDLVATARTDPGNGALVEHVGRVYAALVRPSDATGTTARHGRLIATLAFMAAYGWEQWAATDRAAAQAWLAQLAVHDGRGT